MMACFQRQLLTLLPLVPLLGVGGWCAAAVACRWREGVGSSEPDREGLTGNFVGT